MTDIWDAPAEEIGDDGMDAEERKVAESVYASMMNSMHRSDRSLQSQEFRVGISDLGFCSERLRRFLDRQVPEETDMLAAFHGTWLGEGVERAYKAAHPDATIQAEITVVLKGETNVYEIPGHPDIIHGNKLIDAKSSDGLEVARRGGMDDQQKAFQRHCYAYGAHAAGLFGDISLEGVQVGNLWVDRSAAEKRLYVKLEPFDMEVVEEATRWLDSVVYAWQNKEEAMKEPPRNVCAIACGFAAECRGLDSDVQGMIHDPAALTAVDLSLEATRLTSKANKLKKEAKSLLDGVTGVAQRNGVGYLVRWVDVNATEIEAFTRKGYRKLTIEKVKEPK